MSYAQPPPTSPSPTNHAHTSPADQPTQVGTLSMSPAGPLNC